MGQLYLGLLHRPADSGGRASWVGEPPAGVSESDVEAGFLSSPEYRPAHAAAGSCSGVRPFAQSEVRFLVSQGRRSVAISFVPKAN